MSEKKIQIGGQAVIEGVMMRGPDQIATAIRRKDGTVDLLKKRFISVTQAHPLWKLPIIRGFVSLIEMLIIGIKTLTFSAERGELDYDDTTLSHRDLGLVENQLQVDSSQAQNDNDIQKDKKKFKIEKFYEILSFVFAFFLAFVLFGYVPYLLSGLLKLSENDILFNLFAGSIRIVFFVLYIYLVSLMKEIKRVFEYHGAEHKAVYAHEHKLDLTIENVQKFSTLHPRCGTSFMFLVLLIAILVFSILDTIIAHYWGRFPDIAMFIFGTDISPKMAKLLGALIRLLIHFPFLPLISGISYEIIKLSSKKMNNIWVKMITGPGMALQKITTRQPDDSQVEIAIIALKAALNEDLSKFLNINMVEETK